MTEHSGRAHATWSASASDRLWACPGSLALSAGAPRRESEAAAWGTACHQVAEKALRSGNPVEAYIGTTEKTSYKPFKVDEEMAECAGVFVDYVGEQCGGLPDRALLIEQRFDLASLKPPFDAGGTGDAVILHIYDGTIEIIDLKTGRGHYVKEYENKQLRTYALGALLANPGRWTHVKATIVQPRAGSQPVRSETIHVTDLMDWTADLLAAMRRAAQAAADLHKIDGDVSAAAFADLHLNPGDHCTFCPAGASCPAREKKALAAAHTFFTPAPAVEVAPPPDPRSLPLEKVVAVLDAADMIEGWINAVRAYARELAEAGVDVTDGQRRYVLVEKVGRRAWKDEGAALAKLQEVGLPLDDCYSEPKLKSPAQAEKALGAKRKALIADLIETPVTGVNLVREDRTSRPAVAATAHRFFKPNED